MGIFVRSIPLGLTGGVEAKVLLEVLLSALLARPTTAVRSDIGRAALLRC